MRKTLAIAAFLVMSVGAAHAGSLSDKPATVATILQIVSANGAMEHCARELGYAITGKTGEVSLRKMRAVFAPQLDDERVMELATLAGEVHAGSDADGVWLVASVVDNKVKTEQIKLTTEVCASVEAYLREQMQPGHLLDGPDPGSTNE